MTTTTERPLLGIMLMIAGMMLVPMLDVCAKILGQTYPVLEVVWARYFFHFLWLLPLLAWKGLVWWRMPPSAGMFSVRGLLLLACTLCFFISILDNPIPNSLALLFISPLIITACAPLVLRERLDLRRAGAALLGFAGVLIVLRPASDEFSVSSLWALAAGICYGFYIMTTRKMSQQSPPLLALMYIAIVGLAVMTLIMPFVWVMPDWKGWGLMAMMGLFAASGHFLIIKSCEYAPASLLAPFNYTEIIGASTLSYLLFSYLPDPLMWLGIGIICLSGVYTSVYEYRRQSEVGKASG